MKLSKKIMVAAAVGALGVAAATPAMAFENEFHGMYKLKYFVSNAESGGSAYINPNAGADKLKANNYFEQRARIFYTAKASDDLKLVTGFEIDSVFGDKAQGGISTATASSGAVAFRNSGGALEADAVNLETKHVYLDFKIPSTPMRVTAGIQPVKDSLKGIFFDADVAGINTTTKLGAATIGLGYFRAYDQSYFTTTTTPRGQLDLDIVELKADVNVSKNLKVGAAYYLYSDNRDAQATKLHTLGLNADGKIGPVALSGFAAMQQGVKSGTGAISRTAYSGYAFNAAAKMPIGIGSLRTAILMTTGDDSKDGINTSWQSVNQSLNTPNGSLNSLTGSSTNSYNESNMMLLNRAANMGGTSTDYSIVYDTNNKSQGVWLYSLGYDATITPKLYANANVGFAWVAKDNANKPTDKATNARNASNFQGTEINLETGYKMYSNLTASVQAAYVVLGGYYKNSATNGTATAAKDPENPYTARVVLTYAF